MSDDDLTPAERAEIERVHGVLADAATWAEPPFDLQERVVAAIAEEAGAGRRLRRIVDAQIRERIRHVVIDPRALTLRPIVGGNWPE